MRWSMQLPYRPHLSGRSLCSTALHTAGGHHGSGSARQEHSSSTQDTWVTIEAESADMAGLYTRYFMLLAAIPAVCGFIGMSIIGMGAFGVSIRVPFLSGLASMVVSYVLSLVGVFVLALIVNALAPTFGARRTRSRRSSSRCTPVLRPWWAVFSACCLHSPCWACWRRCIPST